MERQAILDTLMAHQAELRDAGVRHAGLFGSVARGEARADSDILIEFDPAAVPDVFTYAGLKDRIAALLPGRVDVVDRDAPRPHLRAQVLADLLHAF